MNLVDTPHSRHASDFRYGSGSQQALRARNLRTLVGVLQDSGPATQRQLADRTGLSQATVSNLVRILVNRNLAVTTPTVSSGRRANLVAASPHDGNTASH